MATADGAISNVQQERALPYVTNERSRRIIQPLLISGMVTAFFTAVIVVVQLFIEDVPLLRIVPLLWLLTLEGMYTMQWLYLPDQRKLDRIAYRAAELMLIFLTVRLYTWAIFGNWPDMRLFLDYLKNPSLLLFNEELVGTLILALLAWGMALGIARLFQDLAISEWEARYFLTPKKERTEDQRPFLFNRLAMIETFYVQWLWAGALMLFFSAVSTIDLPAATRDFTLNVTRLNLNPALLFALIVYFVTGLLLVSQGRLIAKTARWLREGVVTDAAVEESWYRNSWRLVALTALLTAFLPIGSTTPISRLLSALLGGLFALGAAVLSLILGLLSALFPNAGEGSEEAVQEIVVPPTPVPPAPVTPPPPEPPSEVAQFVFSSAIWAIFLVLAVIAIGYFMRERGIKLNFETLRAAWAKLRLWLSRGWNQMTEQVGDFQRGLARRQVKTEDVEKNGRSLPFNFVRVNGLIPREQVKYFYLSTLRRAEEKGIERRQSLTPQEFKATLLEQFPDSEAEIEELTAAFQQARYSQEEIDDNTVQPIKKRWKRMRSTIRRKRK